MSQFRLSSLPYYGIGAYFIAGAFYIFPSGMPQPADVMLLLFLIIALCSLGRLPRTMELYLVLGLFLAWITCVNVVWFFILQDYRLLIRTSFYMFNALVLLFLVIIGCEDYERLRKFVWWSCIIALVVQFGFVELAPPVARRATGSFNNPNQMAYWALLVLACLSVSKDREPLNYADICAFAIGLYFSLLTASRAGFLSILMLIGLVVVTRRWHKPTLFAVIAAVTLVGLVEVSTGNVSRLVRSESVTSVTAQLNKRLETAHEGGLSYLAQRGYDVLFEYPQYLALGAGEAAYERVERDKEFHSSLGNLLLAYGAVGMGLFLTLMLVVFKNAPLPSLLYMAPIMAFGLSHQGLRFSEFWVFVGFVYAQARYRQSLKAAPRAVGVGSLRRA